MGLRPHLISGIWMRVHLTKKSANRKTGPIPVSTTSEDTCPRSCPFYGEGCYADQGPLRIHWRKVSAHDRGTEFRSFLTQVRSLERSQIWRHNQAGDLPGKGNRINRRLLEQLCNASKGTRGFTYTHKPVQGDSDTAQRNRDAIKSNNSIHFTINLSANGVEHADELVKLGIAPVTTVLSSNTDVRSFTSPGGNKVVVCPVIYDESITCSTCKLCAHPTRKSIIGFPAHGAQKKQVDEVCGYVT